MQKGEHESQIPVNQKYHPENISTLLSSLLIKNILPVCHSRGTSRFAQPGVCNEIQLRFKYNQWQKLCKNHLIRWLIRFALHWPKSLFRYFLTVLQRNPNELFWPTQDISTSEIMLTISISIQYRESESCSVMSDSLRPHGLQSARSLCSWGFSRQKYWNGLPCPPPGDLPKPGTELRSPTLLWILYHLSHQESHEYWSGWPIPSPWNLPDPGIKLGSPALQVNSSSAELPGKHVVIFYLQWEFQNMMGFIILIVLESNIKGEARHFFVLLCFSMNQGLLHCRWIHCPLSLREALFQ